MGARASKARKKTKRRAHAKSPQEREVLLQGLLRETALRKSRNGR